MTFPQSRQQWYRWFFLFALSLGSALAHAQNQQKSWLAIDYTFSDIAYKEPQMSERAQMAGVRGELGLNLMGPLSVSVGGEYQDGHFNYDGSTFSGTPIKQVTNDYIGDLRALIHVAYSGSVFSIGMAERYWFNNLVISYRRRTRYAYFPIQVTYHMQPFYLRFESDIWRRGKNKSHMSDVNAAEKDVEFTLGKGTAYGAEVGVFLPGTVAQTHLFLKYHKWSVKESDVQNDNVYNLVEPENSTTTLQAGIGLQF